VSTVAVRATPWRLPCRPESSDSHRLPPMPDDPRKRAFVSYVSEDSDKIDALCEVLAGAEIPYWRDRESLGPGDAWKSRIREAIRSESLVFLACFSDQSRAREKSYMNEELTIATEEFRQMPPGRKWLIPVRLDDGEVPEWDLGAGRTLRDLNYGDLFGSRYANRLKLSSPRLATSWATKFPIRQR
jgi:hypothetical protein